MKEDFSIIANNCWGAEVYKRYEKPFNTPIIGLYFYPDCYLKFIGNLRHYLKSELKFTNNSKYLDKPASYPIGILGEVEVHFLHYESEEEAFEKWTKRCLRVSDDDARVLFKFDDRDGATKEHLNSFLDMNLPNSICFSKHDISHANHVQVPMKNSAESVMDGLKLFYASERLYNLDEWLSGKGVNQQFNHKISFVKAKIKILLGK